MAQHVRQGFLDDPIHGEPQGGAGLERPTLLQAHRQAGGPELVDQRGQLLEAEGRSRGRPRAVPFTHRGEQATHLPEGAAPGLGDSTDHLPGLLGSLRGGGVRAVGQGDHHREAVRDHVVHLAGDAFALVSARDAGQLITFALHLVGALHERRDQPAPVAHVDAEQGDDQSDAEEQRRGAQPFAHPGLGADAGREAEQGRADPHPDREDQRRDHPHER